MVAVSTMIHLVRHGEVLNPNRVFYGRLSGFRLSRKGREQAHAAGAYFRGKPIGAIYAGPLLRARKTGEAIAAHHDPLKMKVSSLLNEVCSPYEGLPASMVDERDGDVYTYEGNGGCFEQPCDVFSRFLTFLKRVHGKHNGCQIVAVTHGDVVVFTSLWALGWELTPVNKTKLLEAGFPAAYPAHASVTTLTFGAGGIDGRPRITYTVPHEA